MSEDRRGWKHPHNLTCLAGELEREYQPVRAAVAAYSAGVGAGVPVARMAELSAAITAAERRFLIRFHAGRVKELVYHARAVVGMLAGDTQPNEDATRE